MAKTTAAVLPPTIIEFLLDETGSMNRYLAQTLGGYSEFIDEQGRQAGTCLMTLTKFDTRGMRNPFVDLDIGMVPHLTVDTFIPGASTNLYDTIAIRIAVRQQLLAQWDIVPRVLFVCMTDGEDNASQRPITAVNTAVTAATAAGWTFVYLGAYPGSDIVAKNMGFHDSNIRCFEGAKMRETLAELAEATTAYRAAADTKQDFYSSV